MCSVCLFVVFPYCSVLTYFFSLSLSSSLRAAVSAVRRSALSRRSAEPFRPVSLAATAVADAVAAGAAAGAGGTSATGNGAQRHAPAQQREQHQRQRATAQHRDKHSHNREQSHGLPQLPVPPHTVSSHTHKLRMNLCSRGSVLERKNKLRGNFK